MKSFIYKQCLINECLFSMSWVILLKIFIWSKIERHNDFLKIGHKNISMTYDRNMILPISRRYNKNLDFKFITLSFLVLSYPNHKSFFIFFAVLKRWSWYWWPSWHCKYTSLWRGQAGMSGGTVIIALTHGFQSN